MRILMLALAVTALAACGGGPLDGTWKSSNLKCNGSVDQTAPPFDLTINNDKGTFVLDFAAMAPSCTVTFDETYTYKDKTITITPKTVTCTEACKPVFQALMSLDCLPVPAATTFTYEQNGSNLKFTTTAVGENDVCDAGQSVEYNMTKTK